MFKALMAATLVAVSTMPALADWRGVITFPNGMKAEATVDDGQRIAVGKGFICGITGENGATRQFTFRPSRLIVEGPKMLVTFPDEKGQDIFLALVRQP